MSAGAEVRGLLLALRALVDAAHGRSLVSVSSVSDALADRERAAMPPAVRSALHRAMVTLYLSVGALAHAKTASRLFDRGDVGAPIARAHIALVEDRALEAVAAASDALANATLGPRQRAELLVARAAASRRLGGERASLHDLREALRLMQGQGIRSPWWYLVDSDRTALEALAGGAGLADASLLAELRTSPLLFTRLDGFVELTTREREVLLLLVSGLSVTKIAEQLVVSPNTIKKQRASIYRKLGATTREEAAIAAIARGLLDA
jgi:LuxR family maltose regulon positive regulatory protein